MANLSDYLRAINISKENLMNQDVFSESEYPPFVVNRTLSYFIDCLAACQEMNLNPHIDSKLQFDFLINTIRPKKRFSRWAKPEDEKHLSLVKEYYGYNNQKARDALAILSESQVMDIQNRMDKGGVMNGRKKTKNSN